MESERREVAYRSSRETGEKLVNKVGRALEAGLRGHVENSYDFYEVVEKFKDEVAAVREDVALVAYRYLKREKGGAYDGFVQIVQRHVAHVQPNIRSLTGTI